MLSPKTETHVVDAAALRRSLDVLIEEHGTQLAAAVSLGISPQYLHDVLRDRRDIGALAARLGYRPLTVYVPEDGGPTISPELAARLIERMRKHRVDLSNGGAA